MCYEMDKNKIKRYPNFFKKINLVFIDDIRMYFEFLSNLLV